MGQDSILPPKLFGKKVALVPGRKILQLAEYLLAMLPVEIWRLEAEGIQIGMFCAALPGLIFRQG